MEAGMHCGGVCDTLLFGAAHAIFFLYFLEPHGRASAGTSKQPLYFHGHPAVHDAQCTALSRTAAPARAPQTLASDAHANISDGDIAQSTSHTQHISVGRAHACDVAYGTPPLRFHYAEHAGFAAPPVTRRNSRTTRISRWVITHRAEVSGQHTQTHNLSAQR